MNCVGVQHYKSDADNIPPSRMRLYLCSPSHLFFLVAGLTLGVLLATTWELFASYSEYGEELNAVQRRVNDGCVCGQEMQTLQRLAQIALYQSQVNLSAAGEPTAAPEDEAAVNRFLEPPDGDTILTYTQMKRKAYRPGSKKEPSLLNEEYIFKKQLFVGVLTQQAYLPTRVKSVYETWGKEVDKLVFFVGEDCNISAEHSHLPIVKLKGVPDSVYPPLRKAFAVMSYMYKHYVNQFNWFIRADDDMYVRTNKLKDLLRKMHPYESIYLGRAGTGRKDDLKRLRLLSHERYCMGGPGIILSVGAMRLVGPHLDNCLRAVLYHDERTKAEWNDDDVEIGRCLSRKTDIQCSSSMESRKYFIFDYHGDILRPLTLWTKPHFRELITVHPVKDPNNMRSLHHFFTTLEFESKYEELNGLVGYLNDLCETLPPHVAPPRSASTGCDLKLHPHLAYFNSSSIFNYIGTAPGNYIVPQTQVPFIHNPRNKFDLSPWIRFNNSLVQEIAGFSPQHSPYTSFRSEMTHLLNQITPFIASQYTSFPPVDTKIIDGYTRFNPHLGREYLLSLKITLEGRNTPEHKRLHLIRELGPRLSVIEKPLSSLMSPAVHVILPVDRIDNRLKEFLTSYVHTALKHSENQVHLVAVVFSEDHATEVEKELKEISKTSVPVSVTIAIGEGSFNHLRAVEVGMTALEVGASLAFIADVDIRFGRSFFIRCRTNAVRNERVYFPIAFWLFGSQHKQSSFEDHPPALTRWTGQWGSYNFGLVCIYKEDYDIIGGYHDSKHSVELFERVSASALEVMQAPEPDLYHLWRGRTCRELKSNSLREGCQRLKQVGLVDQAELSEYLGQLNNLKNSLVFEDETIGGS